MEGASKVGGASKLFTAIQSLSFKNPFGRFRYAAGKVGYAVITAGEQIRTRDYSQMIHSPTTEEGSSITRVRPLSNIRCLIDRTGHLNVVRANTPDNQTPMTGCMSRKLDYQLHKNDGTCEKGWIVPLSPTKKSVTSITVFTSDDQGAVNKKIKDPTCDKKSVRRLRSNSGLCNGAETPLSWPRATPAPAKRTQSAVIEKNAVMQRKNMARNKKQKDVMKGTAKEAWETFYNNNLHKMTAGAKKFYSNKPNWEWAHVLGWSLSPLGFNSQVKENLGATPKDCNTKMMIIERMARKFSINDVPTKVWVEFLMLCRTNVVREINCKLELQFDNQQLDLHQFISVFEQGGESKESDQLMIVLAAALLLNQSPTHEQSLASRNAPASAESEHKCARPDGKDNSACNVKAMSYAQAAMS